MPDWSAYIQVPHYDVRASAGNGSVVHEENVVDHLVFKRDWVVRGMGLDPWLLVQALSLALRGRLPEAMRPPEKAPDTLRSGERQ